MRAVFHGKLVNDAFGDPGLLVTVLHERRGFLFDLGHNEALSPRELLAVTDVFVTHCHIDHFVGFDRFLRVCLGRPSRVRMVGPPGFIDRVEHKLQGYVWNLADRYTEGLELDVTEIGEGGVGERARFRLIDAFARQPLGPIHLPDLVVLDEDELRVHAAVLDHRTPCLGFALHQKGHFGVMRNRVRELGLHMGPWIGELKRALYRGAHDDEPFSPAPGVASTIGDLRRAILLERPGQRIAYVTDLAFHEANAARIALLANLADPLYIEASFRAADHERATERFHLTAAHAGLLARRAHARRVVPFHFSPRHEGEEDALRAEVQAAFEGKLDAEGKAIEAS